MKTAANVSSTEAATKNVTTKNVKIYRGVGALAPPVLREQRCHAFIATYWPYWAYWAYPPPLPQKFKK